jgi:hypothetical protein
MKINVKKLVIIGAAIALVVAIPLIVFQTRAPVLILTEQSFIMLYGEDRIRRESSSTSLALFRPVRTVVIANEASDDIIQIAINDVSSRPFCVLFPFRFALAAAIYQEQNPNIRVVILAGIYSVEESTSTARQAGCFIYKTDIEADFYKAGIVAAALSANNGNIALFLEPDIQSQAGQAFLRGINDQEKPLEAHFFTSFSDFSRTLDPSCVVMAGTGTEYLDEKNGVPVIFFTWLNPSMVPGDVVMVINDSPWVQAVQAVTLAASGERDGRIGSKFLILDRKKIDRRILRKIDIDS